MKKGMIHVSGNPELTLFPSKKTIPLGDLYGIFFEDINHAADGGLYAEMVENRSFEFDTIDKEGYEPAYAWLDGNDRPIGESASIYKIGTDQPVHPENPHYLLVHAQDEAVLQNRGFNGGMYFAGGRKYRFSVFARSLDREQTLSIELTDGKRVLGKANIVIHKADWEKYTVIIPAAETTAAGRLCLKFPRDSNVAIDMISLFPTDTFKGRENGLRKDLAEMLADMKPKFMRFPGGCLVHDGSLDASARDSMYRWKNTLGPVEKRPSRRNNWQYNQTLGLGYYEYFVFCEDIGT